MDSSCGLKDPECHDQEPEDVRNNVREAGSDRSGKGDGAEIEPAEMTSGESGGTEPEMRRQESEDKSD